MGCDMHAYREVKIDGEWVGHCPINIRRNYLLFAEVAGVRNYDDKPYVEPRGFPEDVSKLVARDFKEWGRDAHTPSWLTWAEWCHVTKDYRGYIDDPVSWFDLDEYEPGCYDNSLNVAEARVVFWFDN